MLCMDPETSVVIGRVAHTADGDAAAAEIASIALNKDAVAAASRAGPQLTYYSRAVQSLHSTQDRHQQQPPAVLHILGTVALNDTGKPLIIMLHLFH